MSCTTLFTLATTLFILYFQSYALATNVTSTNITQLQQICPPGTYSLTDGNAPCYDCPAGSYSGDSGAKECIPARTGYYVPTSGMKMDYACLAGSYSNVVGSISCSPCPPGHQCPNDALVTPEPCSPGGYSAGGSVINCSLCPAGSFSSIQGATECCSCCPGYFSDHPGSTNCQSCSSWQPYSNPSAMSQKECSFRRGIFAPEPSCTQKQEGRACPTATRAFASHIPSHASKRDIRPPRCLKPGQKACPLYRAALRRAPSVIIGYDCVDIENDLESCGGCADRSLGDKRSNDGGRDCSAIPNVDAVRCEYRRCVIESCRPGSVKSPDGEHCIFASALWKQE